MQHLKKKSVEVSVMKQPKCEGNGNNTVSSFLVTEHRY